MSELMTLVCAAQRNSQQMEILLRKFEPLVRKYARRIHKLEIDDAMQEMSLAFLQLIRKMDLSKFSGPDADKLFLAYLRRAMETRFLDIVKQQENTIIIAFDEVANQDQEDESLSLEDRLELREMLGGLTDVQQKVIIAKYLDGYSDAEIAARLHISRQAVNRAKNRAIAYLKVRYK